MELKFRAYDGTKMLYSHENNLDTPELQLAYFFQKLDYLKKKNGKCEVEQWDGKNYKPINTQQ